MGFTFNGQHTEDYRIYFTTSNIPLLPQMRTQEETVLERDGVFIYEDGYNNKTIELNCSFVGANNIKERRQILRRIASWLRQEGELVFDNEPDKFYKGKIYNQIDLSLFASYDEFNLIFNVDPFAYSRWDNQELLQNMQGIEVDGRLVPYMQTKFTNISSNRTVTLSNLGNYEVSPVIELDGSADSVTISAGDKSFSVTGISDTTYIDCNNFIAYEFIGGNKVNKLNDFSGQFIELKEGLNSVTIEGSNLNLSSVHFIYRNRYV